MIAAPDKIASYRLLERELELDEIVRDMAGVDIILVEGYRRANRPPGVVRAANGQGMISTPDQCFAVATDATLDVEVPQFHLDDARAIADLIEAKFLPPGAS